MSNRLLCATLLCFIWLFGAASAENIAMLSSGSGVVTGEGKKLAILDFLQKDQSATVEAGAQATFSYISGGARYTVTGPCQVTFLESGPRKTGKSGKIESKVPEKRVGRKLPSELNLKFGGQVRRGELHLHLPRYLLPGRQVLHFSATPAFDKYYVTVFDSQDRKYESEELTETHWVIPEGVLQPGESYRFILDGVTDSGRTETIGAKENDQKLASVLDEPTAEIVRQAMEAREGETDTAGRVELLSYFLKYQLDALALDLMNELSEVVSGDDALSEKKEKLEMQLEYATATP